MLSVSVPHAWFQVSAKLKAVLRPNPKRARPTCRKPRDPAVAAVVKADTDDVPPRQKVKREISPLRDQELWEVDSSASEVEMLGPPSLNMVASGSMEPASCMHCSLWVFLTFMCYVFFIRASKQNLRPWRRLLRMDPLLACIAACGCSSLSCYVFFIRASKRNLRPWRRLLRMDPLLACIETCGCSSLSCVIFYEGPKKISGHGNDYFGWTRFLHALKPVGVPHFHALFFMRVQRKSQAMATTTSDGPASCMH